MKSYIRRLFEMYSDTESMRKSIKDSEDETKKLSKRQEERIGFAQEVMGKSMVKRLSDKEKFAPVYVGDMGLTAEDFDSLVGDDATEEKTERLVERLSKCYVRNTFKLKDSVRGNGVLNTNLVFREFDELIDFFYNIKKIVKSLYHTDDIKYNKIVNALRKYLK